MNKRIRSMIDAIFSEMKMTAENLALRDELMANAQARYDDAVSSGKTEDEAFAEVAASLEDVQSLLLNMNPESVPGASAKQDNPHAQDHPETPDLGDALNKAFSALGDWGQSIMPQAKKFARQMDDATGGMLRDIGRAVNKGMREAQKAAGDVLDRYQQEQTAGGNKTPHDLREEALDLRAQADLKCAAGDVQGADGLRTQADALEMQADALELELTMAQAEDDAAADAGFVSTDEEPQPTAQRPLYGADGELDEAAFAESIEEMSREAERIADDAQSTTSNELRFPVAGLRGVDVKLDADDVSIEPAAGSEIIVRWNAHNTDGVPDVALHHHTLTIRRKNPDVFKTFFSVFSKNGGQITILVPHGYAADYTLATTSGNVRLSGIDADDIRISTTSGDVRIEPDASRRAGDLKIESISGSITVSAMAEDIEAQSVSGDVFISCDAANVKGNVVSGSLHIEGACSAIDADAVSGDIRTICTVTPTGKIKINTLSGNAHLLLPGSIRGFVVNFNSMSGKMTNEFGPDRYGTCALPIEVNTVSGSLTLGRL